MVLPKQFQVTDEKASFQFDKIEIGLIDSLTAMGGRVSIAKVDGLYYGNYEDEKYAILSIQNDHHMALMALFNKYVELKVKEGKTV